MNKFVFSSFFGLICLCAVCTVTAGPTTFNTIFGSALLCHDEVSGAFFRQYLRDFYKEPLRTEGEAEWFSVSETLFGLKLQEGFVNHPASEYEFVGVVIASSVEEAKKALESNAAVRFFPIHKPNQYRSAAGSMLIDYGPTQSKLYCAKRKPRRVPLMFQYKETQVR